MIELGVEPKRKSVVIAEDEPAHYLILGDFGGRSTEPLAIDRDNFDAVMAKLQVNLAGAPFRELEDFHPDHLYRNLNLFREFDVEPAAAAEKSAQPAPRADIGELLRSSSLLEQIAEGGDPFDRYLRELTRAHAASPEFSDLQRDAALGERLRGLLHHPRFQTVEAAWRGLDFVIRSEAGDDSSVRLRIAHFPKAEAARDLLEAKSLGETRMHALLSARKWRAVIGLYAFGPEAADIEFLGRMALLAAHIGAPFIAEGSVDMGDHWEELRAIPEASYLGLALPRFLLRLPYGTRTSAIDSFPFEEMPAAPAHAHYLWGNPALAFLTLLTAGGALNIEGLPLHAYQHEGEWRMTPCAEVWMTETQVLALIDLGLMPLVSFRDSDRVRLAGFRAINGEELALPSA
jgi:type VI secretion system protein ImpC